MQLGKYFKVPADRKRYSIDYSDWLDSGEIVSNVAFGVTSPLVGDATPVVIDGNSTDPSGLSIAFFASAGTAGTTYTVDVTMTTSAGQVREDTVQFTVKSV